MIKTHLQDDVLKYDGTQLHSHFAYQNYQICGDSIVSFIGPCEVTLDHMVDLEDVHQKKPIFSENMVHFIVEHFESDLEKVIAYQRLLIDCVLQDLQESNTDIKLIRRGDDLFDDHHKLTVSIATSSPISCLIHVGVNISSKNTPVATKGLDDYQLNPHAMAMGVMNRYRDELNSMKKARAKVKGVQ